MRFQRTNQKQLIGRIVIINPQIWQCSIALTHQKTAFLQWQSQHLSSLTAVCSQQTHYQLMINVALELQIKTIIHSGISKHTTGTTCALSLKLMQKLSKHISNLLIALVFTT